MLKQNLPHNICQENITWVELTKSSVHKQDLSFFFLMEIECFSNVDQLVIIAKIRKQWLVAAAQVENSMKTTRVSFSVIGKAWTLLAFVLCLSKRDNDWMYISPAQITLGANVFDYSSMASVMVR